MAPRKNATQNPHAAANTESRYPLRSQRPNPATGGSSLDAEYAKVNIYAAVDSWRSYGGTNGTSPQNLIPQFNPSASAFTPLNNTPSQVPPAQFTPYQPLRLVENYIRYSKYRINKASRYSNSTGSGKAFDQVKQVLNDLKQQRNVRPTYDPDVAIQSVETGISNINLTPSGRGQNLAYKRGSSTPFRTVTPPSAPSASPEYRKQAQQEPCRFAEPKKLLIILDLNGTLLFRPTSASGHKGAKFIARPGAANLLSYLFEHHAVMIYTSARPENAEAMVNKLLTPQQQSQLVAVWARDKLGLTPNQYKQKVQVYKKLEPIWNDRKIQGSWREHGRWNQSNTVLVDDSRLKALAQPHNLLQLPEFTAQRWNSQSPVIRAKNEAHQEQILQSLVVKLEELKWHEDVSRVIMRWQNGKLEIPKVPGSGFAVDEMIDQKEVRARGATEFEDAKEEREAVEEVLGDRKVRRVRHESPITAITFESILGQSPKRTEREESEVKIPGLQY